MSHWKVKSQNVMPYEPHDFNLYTSDIENGLADKMCIIDLTGWKRNENHVAFLREATTFFLRFYH
jgi:hypothetical protein